MRHHAATFTIACFVLLGFVSSAHAFQITRVSSNVLYRDGGEGLTAAYVAYRLTNNDAQAHPDVWVSATFANGASIRLASNDDGIQHIGPMAVGESKTAFFYVVATAIVTTAQNHTVRAYTPANATLGTQTFGLTASDTIQAMSNKVTVVTHTPSGPGVGGTLVITVNGETGTVGNLQRMSFTPASVTSWRPDAFQLEATSINVRGDNNITVIDQLAFTVIDPANSPYTAVYTFRIVGTTATSTPVTPVSYIESGSEFKHTSVTSNEYEAIPPAPPPINRLTLTRSPTVSELPASGGTLTLQMTVTSTDSQITRLDKFVETFTSGGATYVPGSTTLNSKAVPDPTVVGSVWTWAGTLEVPANGSLILSFQASYAASSGTHVQSGAANVGPTQIDGTLTTGDDASPDLTVYVGNAPDSDGDGVSNAKESTLGTDPNDNDTDNDGILDGAELGGDGVYDVGSDTTRATPTPTTTA